MELVVYSAGWSEFCFDVWFEAFRAPAEWYSAKNANYEFWKTSRGSRPYTPILWNQKLFPSFKFDFSLPPTIRKERERDW